MRIIVLPILILVSMSLQATTLRNVTLDDVVNNANEVMLLKVVEAKLLEIEEVSKTEDSINNVERESYEEEEAQFSGIYSTNCGVNVKAKVINNYKSSKEEYVHFTTMEHVELGTSYLSFLNRIDSKSWYASNFRSFTINGKKAGDHPNELKCLQNAMALKALAFPQRLMKYDESQWLDVSLNNIIFPREVLMRAKEEQSVIQQYNRRQIDFESIHEYLLKLKTKKSSNK